MDAQASTPARPQVEARWLTMQTVGMNATTWHYAANRTFVRTPINDTLRPGFFNAAAARLRAGDRIEVSAIDGAATLYVFGCDGEWVSTAVLAWVSGLVIPTNSNKQEAPDARTD